jgi:predicted adenylyl cyclase CyaB
MPLNIEFKAKVKSIQEAENKLLLLNPLFVGEDNQTDTYFNVQEGRMKLREGNVENALIYYKRNNVLGSKESNVILYEPKDIATLKALLISSLGVKVAVIKKRRIYFIENVKFHFDWVEQLGAFIEVEAIDKDGSIGKDKLEEQCQYYAAYFNILKEDYISNSYSDMLLALKL